MTRQPHAFSVMRRSLVAAAALVAGATVLGPLSAAEAETITLWSHWADHESKVAFVESAARAFEEANPGVDVEITWYQKDALYAALSTALRAGQAPDIFYAEPDQVEYMDNKLLLDLSDSLNWENIEPWAKEVWGYEDGVYGFPLEAWTVELYYDRKRMQELGIEVPDDLQFDQTAFLDIVKTAREAGVTPISLGVGDRPYPGAFLVQEALLKELGKDDYRKLLEGDLGWDDPRVMEALVFVRALTDAGALPESFSSLKLSESHQYFHTNPGALMFLMGSFYPSRAFNPPEKGGQPADFQLGVMHYPAMDDGACNDCKTITVGGSYVVNAATEHPELAVELLNSMATPEMGNKWLETVLVQTGIKTDPSKISGPYADYFQQLAKVNEGVDYFFGLPNQVMQGGPKEVFTQVVNAAFPAGLVTVDEVVEKMNAAK